ncbi:Spy/CpxP family protein refolding chaperone [Marinomonas ostreistagni]|uniref:Spy/CpxP family protein refolding chaperone n=1 Tax=Marinomonas ostreistagni TaxID=359209 RepID=UPI00194E76DD|nr:Spy/CpxP family protein refolding chaperone [Marinomonas ostreistagni]MBM6549918.1 Spy/CpxP family protein refolding chaperone [Marinomonas ostreistagni]
MAILNNNLVKCTALGLAVAIAASATSLTYAADNNNAQAQRAQQAQQMMNPYSEQMLDRMATQLKMDADTRQEASELFAEAREGRKEILDDMRELTGPVQMLSPKDDNYVSQVEELAEQRSDLMVRMDVQQAEIRHQFYELLSDEQIAQLEAGSQQRGS